MSEDVGTILAALLNPLDENGEPKSAKQLDKDAKKAAKLQKLAQKIEKQSTAAPVNKEKAEVRFGEDCDDEIIFNIVFTHCFIRKSQ